MAISPLVDANCEVIIRDENMEDNGEIRNLVSFDTTLKLNDVSSWQLNMHTSDYNLLNAGDKSFTFGDGIQFKRDNELLMSGPMMMLKKHYLAGSNTVTLIGGDDNFWLMTRVCYPVVEGMIFEDGVYRFGRRRTAEGLTTTITTDTIKADNKLIVASTNGFLPGAFVTGTDTAGQTIGPAKIASIDYPQNTIYIPGGWSVVHGAGSTLVQVYTGDAQIDDPTYLGFDSRVGPAERVMKELVVFNAGEHSCVDQWGPRAIPHLKVPSNYGRGIEVTSNARGENLLTQIQSLSNTGGLLFRIEQVGTDLEFDVWKGADLTTNTDLIFSVESGNLKEYEATIGLPIANMLIGVGPNPGVDKIMLPTGDPDSISQFGRFEGWQNASQGNAGDTPVLINAAMLAANQAALLTQAYVSSASLTIQETDQVRFPRDFRLGDTVRTMVGNEPVDHVITNIDYTVPAGSGGGAGSALTGFLKKQMNRTMTKLGYQGDLLKQILLNS
jgi:hypothetical protein